MTEIKRVRFWFVIGLVLLATFVLWRKDKPFAAYPPVAVKANKPQERRSDVFYVTHYPVSRFGFGHGWFAEATVNGVTKWIPITTAKIYQVDSGVMGSVAIEDQTGKTYSVTIPDGSQFHFVGVTGPASREP
jgi:hypothetical protein